MTHEQYTLNDNEVREVAVNSTAAAIGKPAIDDTPKDQISDILSIFRGKQRELFGESSDRPLPSPHAIEQTDGHA